MQRRGGGLRGREGGGGTESRERKACYLPVLSITERCFHRNTVSCSGGGGSGGCNGSMGSSGSGNRKNRKASERQTDRQTEKQKEREHCLTVLSAVERCSL